MLKGLSPGAALVFLLSGPATNLGAVIVLLKFLGRRVMMIYLASILVVSVAAGYALDRIYRAWRVNPVATYGRATEFIPDREVHAAFRDVASAQEDKILIVNRATTFAQEAVNLAEGDAAAMIESARAFKDERVQAEGDALAFTLREKEYRRAPDLTRFRLHLEALEDILPPAQKILRPDKRGREGLRPLAAPAVRREEGPVKALPRTLTLVGAVGTALAIWSCFVVIDVTELRWCYGKTPMQCYSNTLRR